MDSQVSKKREKEGDGALKDGRLDLKGFHLCRPLSNGEEPGGVGPSPGTDFLALYIC